MLVIGELVTLTPFEPWSSAIAIIMLNCGPDRPSLLPNRRRNSSIRFATVTRSAISLRSARSEPADSKTVRVARQSQDGGRLSLEVFGIVKEVRDQFISLTYTTRL